MTRAGVRRDTGLTPRYRNRLGIDNDTLVSLIRNTSLHNGGKTP